MSGADRYGDAQIMLRAIHKGHPDEDLTLDQKIALAQVEATLAVAGAVALNMLLPVVGDGDDVTDWARLIATGTARGRSRGVRVMPHAYPANWPPKPGEVWRDSRDETWAVMASGKLVPLANDIDDHPHLWPADEVELKFGPTTRVREAWGEVPF